MNKKIPLLILFSVFLSGCVMAPLSNNVTARSNGKGKWNTQAGYSEISSVYLWQGYGLTDRLDLGVNGEGGINNVVGIWGRYSLLNQQDGLSLAIVGGGGGGKAKGEESINGVPVSNNETYGYYLNVGPIVSYKFKYFEPYVIARFNYVHLNEKILPKAHDDLNFNVADHATYGALGAGGTIWFNNAFGITANVNTLVSSHDASKPFVNGGIILRY